MTGEPVTETLPSFGRSFTLLPLAGVSYTMICFVLNAHSWGEFRRGLNCACIQRQPHREGKTQALARVSLAVLPRRLHFSWN